MDEEKKTLVGSIHGRWKVLYELPKSINQKVHCVCECGVTRDVDLRRIVIGTSKSCGCYAREQSGNRLRGSPVVDCIIDGVFFKSTFEGNFGVSKCGLVIGRKHLVLTPRNQGHYLIVSYTCVHDGKIKSRNKYVHRLVATEWVENSNEDFKIVNHKDGDKLNNNFSNLEWVNYRLNSKHAVDTGLLWNVPSKGQQGFQTSRNITQ